MSVNASTICTFFPQTIRFLLVQRSNHDLTSMNQTSALLEQAFRQSSVRPVLIMEATSRYHLILFQFFQDLGYQITVVIPLRAVHERFWDPQEENRYGICFQTGNALSNKDVALVARLKSSKLQLVPMAKASGCEYRIAGNKAKRLSITVNNTSQLGFMKWKIPASSLH